MTQSSPTPTRTRVVRCAPKHYPCPHCGQPGRRTRRLRRPVRSLAYRQILWLDLHYAEYKPRCTCCKSFRSCPPDILPKADYDSAVRQAVLDRILQDGLNVERTRQAMQRDFLLNLSSGFVYDCLRWRVGQLDLAPHRQFVLAQFSGTLCVDEVHLGRFTLVLATDPLADLPVAFALVSTNDQDHLRRFLANLQRSGLQPRVVVTDGSALYPRVLAEVWPQAQHQLCVFHLLADVNDLILKAARRLAGALTRRGRCGRKRHRGRPTRRQQQARAGRDPSRKEQAAFILQHRWLLVKNSVDLDAEQRATLQQLFAYLPELRTLWQFAEEVQSLFAAGVRVQTAWKRWWGLQEDARYQGVPELAKALRVLRAEQFGKAVAYTKQVLTAGVRTNNHVERLNRRLRFWEKVRYKWRRRRWVVRFVVLALDGWWRQAQEAARTETKPDGKQAEPPPPRRQEVAA